MKPKTMTFRVRRPARQRDAADTLHVLEWLGGEALVAPLPIEQRPRPPAGPARRPEDAGADWIVI